MLRNLEESVAVWGVWAASFRTKMVLMAAAGGLMAAGAMTTPANAAQIIDTTGHPHHDAGIEGKPVRLAGLRGEIEPAELKKSQRHASNTDLMGGPQQGTDGLRKMQDGDFKRRDSNDGPPPGSMPGNAGQAAQSDAPVGAPRRNKPRKRVRYNVPPPKPLVEARRRQVDPGERLRVKYLDMLLAYNLTKDPAKKRKLYPRLVRLYKRLTGRNP